MELEEATYNGIVAVDSPSIAEDSPLSHTEDITSNSLNEVSPASEPTPFSVGKILKRIVWKPPVSMELSTAQSTKTKSSKQRRRAPRVSKPKKNSKSDSLKKEEINVELPRLLERNDEDIIESSITIGLQDPITKSRMLTPVRSINCSHIDSFDLDNFFKLHNISKVKVRSRRTKTDLSLVRNSEGSLEQKLNPYLDKITPLGKHEHVNKPDYLMLKMENKYMGRDNNNLRYFACPICDKEFNVFTDLYVVDFLQEIIVELNNNLINKNVSDDFVDILTQRKHKLNEVTHVVIDREGKYNFHVEDKYMESLETHELVELLDDDDNDDNNNNDNTPSLPSFLPTVKEGSTRKRKNITIQLSDSEDWLESLSSIDETGWDEENPICIDD